MRRCLWALLAGISLLGLTSCGGGTQGTAKAPGDPSISISPTSATLYCGQTQQFTVTVTGLASSAVVWTVDGMVGGTATTGAITSSGLYTCPGAGFADGTQVTVTATSIVDSTQSASATVTLKLITISLRPKDVTVGVSQTQQFTVTANTPANASVTFAVNGVVGGNSTVGTISSTGLYTAPATVPNPSVVTVTATSTIDPAITCSSTVTIFSGPATLTSVSPSTITVGSFTLTLVGSNFAPGAQVFLGSTLLTASFVSSTQLTATGTATVAMLGAQAITVVNPGTAASNAVNVTVVSPVPSLSSVSPSTIIVGPFTLTLAGSNFVSGAQAFLGGAPLTTTFVSSTQLTATGTATEAMLGAQAITVQNPGAVASNAVSVTVSTGVAPAATLTSVSPMTINIGPFTLTLVGTGFVSGAQAFLGSTPLTTTFVSSTQLTATGTATAAMLGVQAVTVQNPGAAASNAVNITVTGITSSASGSTAVLGGMVNGTLVDKAYIPIATCAATGSSCVAVVNIDSTSTTGALVTNIPMPSGYNANATAASSNTNQVIVVSYTSSDVQIIDATKDVLVSTVTAPVTGQANFSGGSCTICGALLDPASNQFILDTAQGFLLLDPAKGTFSSILTPLPAENFAYDPNTQLILDPNYNPGIQIISLKDNSVEDYSGTPPEEPDSGTFDPTTNIAMVTDEFAQMQTFFNMQEAQITPGTGAVPGSWTAPSTLFDLTNLAPSCFEWTLASVESSTHLLLAGTEFSDCAAVETLPSSTVSGAPPMPTTFHFGNMPSPPDGSFWDNGGDPHGIAVFTSVVDGKAYGFFIQYPTQAYVARIDLTGVRDAPVMAGTTNQVDLTPFVFFISTQ